ncbi:acyl carrier protein [Lysobacter sp. CFH 32150]|uniref:acyl carrier protein n=1 Tax=Lysobacter sp. CFH 32150 TaxID=2927128 RepID=UPI001FA779C3|nr:acyl carrier protein [Lysobacter sp. CFH 32150]MCI4567033.1 acyl carrier protein [Lysobacter sp. CFH 32150]
MDKEQVLAKLKEMLHERFSIDMSQLRGDTRRADIGIDSILMVDLMLDIETELDFTFDMMDMPSNPSLDEVSELILRNLNKSAT